MIPERRHVDDPGVVAERRVGEVVREVDPDRAPPSWISDLATRTEATGWRFQLLAILSGLAISAFALLLRRVVAIPPAIRIK